MPELNVDDEGRRKTIKKFSAGVSLATISVAYRNLLLAPHVRRRCEVNLSI